MGRYAERDVNDQPLYRQIAERLRGDIRSGRFKPGEQIPTELSLCDTLGISRHTAREALRILTEDGLIVRRRGAGTVVAETRAPAFAQSLGDFDDILQYARAARFGLASHGTASAEDLEALGLIGDFQTFTGMRGNPGEPPIAITRIFVLDELAPDVATLKALDTSISEWIEKTHGRSVSRVTQRMEAVALNASQAKRLGVDPKSPALRTVRRYRDTKQNVILLSESLHPAGRFAYEMRLERKS